MRRNTIITLAASLAFGILAVFLARGWIKDAVRSQYDQVENTAQPTIVTAQNTVPVLVVDSPLEFGDVVTPDVVRIADYPEDSVPEGAYHSLNQLFVNPQEQTVALRRMGVNEALLDTHVSGPGARGSLSALIGEGMRAVSVRVNDVSGVSGFVVPGDYVDLIFTRDETGQTTDNNLVSDVLLQHVRVLGIDQNLNEDRGVAAVARTVTLEVSNEQAQKLDLASGVGRLSLSLRKQGDVLIEPTRTVRQSGLVAAATPAPKPKRTYRPPSPKVPAGSPTADVTIIRGEEVDQVKVLKENQAADELAGG